MSHDRSFKLLAPDGYGSGLDVSGNVDALKDARIVGHSDPQGGPSMPLCIKRNNLPDFRGIKFEFNTSPSGKEKIENFYHQGDFFIVTKEIRDFLNKNLGDGIEIVSINIHHQGASHFEEPYFAVKIKKQIDCIDPDSSFAQKISSEKVTELSFSELTSVCDLEENMVADFSNTVDGRYKSYPLHFVNRVKIIDDRIPEDALLFEPRFWPGKLLIRSDFVEQLKKICTDTWCFWLLDLENVTGSYFDFMQSFR